MLPAQKHGPYERTVPGVHIRRYYTRRLVVGYRIPPAPQPPSERPRNGKSISNRFYNTRNTWLRPKVVVVVVE